MSFNIAGNKVCTKQGCLLRQEKDPKEVAARILAIGLIDQLPKQVCYSPFTYTHALEGETDKTNCVSVGAMMTKKEKEIEDDARCYFIL